MYIDAISMSSMYMYFNLRKPEHCPLLTYSYGNYHCDYETEPDYDHCDCYKTSSEHKNLTTIQCYGNELWLNRVTVIHLEIYSTICTLANHQYFSAHRIFSVNFIGPLIMHMHGCARYQYMLYSFHYNVALQRHIPHSFECIPYYSDRDKALLQLVVTVNFSTTVHISTCKFCSNQYDTMILFASLIIFE